MLNIQCRYRQKSLKAKGFSGAYERHNGFLYFLAGPEFRGCADAEFLHENKCTRELQAVTVIDSVKHVDVNVELCYCDNDLCNEERNAAYVIHYTKSIPLLVLMNVLLF